jgi:hypothetical protein
MQYLLSAAVSSFPIDAEVVNELSLPVPPHKATQYFDSLPPFYFLTPRDPIIVHSRGVSLLLKVSPLALGHQTVCVFLPPGSSSPSFSSQESRLVFRRDAIQINLDAHLAPLLCLRASMTPTFQHVAEL